jgi:hypothetical protein
MADKNQNREWQPSEPDALDRELNAALAKYAAAEPRPGLEERVLAHLRTESERARSWWVWGATGGLAAMVVIVAVAWRIEKPRPSITATHAPAAARDGQNGNRNYDRQTSAVRVDSNAGAGDLHPRASTLAVRRAPHRVRREVVAAGNPKLDQFPSPQALTAQELALVRYVRQFPQEATLIARAQEEDEKEIQKKMKDANAETEGSGSGQQER